MGAWACGEKVWKTFMSIESQQEHDDKVHEDLNVSRGGWGACEGQPLALRGAEGRFFRSAGACPPQSLPHPGHPVHPGHPASDAINIKVLTDLFSVLRRRAIDIQVLSDL